MYKNGRSRAVWLWYNVIYLCPLTDNADVKNSIFELLITPICKICIFAQSSNFFPLPC